MASEQNSYYVTFARFPGTYFLYAFLIEYIFPQNFYWIKVSKKYCEVCLIFSPFVEKQKYEI